jgi:transposase
VGHVGDSEEHTRGGEVDRQPDGDRPARLGHLGDEQIASLAGVAPHPDESGNYLGRACIRGGRPRVRAKLYLSAFNARKYNPVIGEFYRRLVSRGKTFMQVMTACMRKPLD